MAFIPNNELEQYLMNAQSDSAARPRFYEVLAASDFYIIQEGPIPQKAGQRVLQAGETLNIRPMQWEGKAYLPVFSSLQRLQEYVREEVGYISFSAMTFMNMTKGSNLFLNPGADFGKELIVSEIEAILNGSLLKPTEQYVAQKNEEVIIGQPANYPTELANTLTRFFGNKKEVKRAYLAHFYNPNHDEKPHTLIGIEIDSGASWEEIAGGAGMVANGVNVPDPPVDFLRITGKGGVESFFVNESKPFYKRKLFGIF